VYSLNNGDVAKRMHRSLQIMLHLGTEGMSRLFLPGLLAPSLWGKGTALKRRDGRV